MNEKKDLTGNISKEIKAIKSVGGQIKFSTSDLMSSSRVINQTQLNLNKKQKKFIDSIKNKKILVMKQMLSMFLSLLKTLRF